jgi:Mu transposase, C-terminal domain
LSYREPGRYHASGSLVSTENGVGYVKRNAIAGRSFPSWEAFEAHLEAWTRDVARYARAWHDRRGADRAVPARRGKNSHVDRRNPPFQAARELFRRVQSDCAVEIDGNAYSVPWRLIGEMVRVTIMDGTVRIHHGLHEVAIHPICASRRRRVIDPAHFEGLTGFRPSRAGELALSPITPAAHLILVLILFGGGWYGRGRWF